jgi:3-oxoacyl-[acyl-carrier protein] reductase
MTVEGLKGRTAIITAAGQNVGRAVALAFAKAGANVVVNGLSELAKIEETARQAEAFGVEALPILADAADWASVEKMVGEAVSRFGKVDIAVSAVGIRPHQAFHDITVEDWDLVIKTNLNSAFYLNRAVLPHMRANGFGRIIHMAGSDAQFPLANRAHVVASKHALHGLAKAIALEYGPDGITANSVAPGWVETDRNPEWFPELKKTLSHLRETLPLRHLGDVDDIANACVYLASDMGKFMTGQMIHLNGGEFMA